MGRCKGAATEILYASNYKGIKAIISDNSSTIYLDYSTILRRIHANPTKSLLINTVIDR